MSKARDLADFSSVASDIGRKNLIINGAMQVAQRGTSTYTLPSSAAYGLTDRWIFQNVSGGTITVDLSTDVPNGFKNSMKFTVTTADTNGLASTDRCTINHKIEGQNMVQLAQGTADATGFTMSFWVKSSVTGTFGGAFANTSVNYSYPFEYTINSADTWEYKTISVSGATTGTWATDNTIGMFVWFSLGMGSNRTGTAGSWQSGDNRGATGTVNLVENAGATFQLTGVQLEVGTVATPFEHRSYGEELALCQRYFWYQGYLNSVPQRFANQLFSNYNSTEAYTSITFPVQMRSTPTATASAIGGFSYYSANGSRTISSLNFQNADQSSLQIRMIGSGFTEGYVGHLDADSSSYITFDAEL